MNKSNKLINIGIIAISVVAIGIIATIIIRRRKRGSGALKNKNPKSILFVGDSVTAIQTASGQSVKSTYPNIVKKELEPMGISVDVLAKGGMTTKWMLENLPSKLKEKKFDRIYIYGGINDSFSGSFSQEKTISNVQKMVDLGKENGADVYIILGYRIDNFMDFNKMKPTRYVTKKEGFIPLIENYKKYQSNLKSQIKNALFVAPIDLSGKTGDGIHPTGEGQKIIAQKIIETIKK
jgi:lysophospholipase L1-like esterase